MLMLFKTIYWKPKEGFSLIIECIEAQFVCSVISGCSFAPFQTISQHMANESVAQYRRQNVAPEMMTEQEIMLQLYFSLL